MNLSKKKKQFLSSKNIHFKIENIDNHQKNLSSHDFISNNEIDTKKVENKYIKDNVFQGINWEKVTALIPTKTMAQVKSFAQNFFLK